MCLVFELASILDQVLLEALWASSWHWKQLYVQPMHWAVMIAALFILQIQGSLVSSEFHIMAFMVTGTGSSWSLSFCHPAVCLCSL
jgi:hypothetical protein